MNRWYRPGAVSAVLLGLLLSACVLPPKDEPTQKPITANRLGLDGAAVPPAAEGWWKQYKDPQLDSLVAQTLDENPVLATVMTRIRSAQAQASLAQAGQLPQLGLDASATRQHFPEQYIYPPPYAGNEWWTGDVGVNLSWDLDLFGRQAALIEQAKDQVQAAALDARTARLAIAGVLAQSYLDLYRADALADIATQSEQQREHILALTRKRVAAGLDTNVELREAEGALPQARLAKLQAEVSAELAKHKLAALANRGGAQAYAEIHRPQVDLEAALPLPQQLPADLLARRPDILAAKASVEAATAGRRAAHQAFYPDVNLSALAGLQAIGLSNLFEASSRSLSVGPALHLPLFDAGRLEAGYHAATAGLDSAIAQYNQTVLYAVQQVADQLSKVDSYNKQLVQARAAQQSAEEAYRLADKRYSAGLTNYLVVLNAETQVLTARRAVVDTLSNQAIARVSLLLAIGGDFTPPPASQQTADASPHNTPNPAQ